MSMQNTSLHQDGDDIQVTAQPFLTNDRRVHAIICCGGNTISIVADTAADLIALGVSIEAVGRKLAKEAPTLPDVQLDPAFA